MNYKVVECILQNNETGNIYDISNLIGNIKIKKDIKNTAGKLTFDLVSEEHKIEIPMGSVISLKVDNKGMFFGYVFAKDGSQVTVYDQLRYLKNSESMVLTGLSHEQVIQRIANLFNLRLGTIEGTKYILPSRVEDNKVLGDIIQRALDFTLQGTGRRYILRDEFGLLCCRDLSNLVSSIIISEDSLLLEYDYKEDIDSETYTSIKLYKDNKETGKRETYITQDSNTQKKWGKLQLYKSIDENIDYNRAKEMGEQMLKIYNRPNKRLKLKCQGIKDLDAGNGVYVKIDDIKINQLCLIESIDHSFNNGIHAMDLEVIFE